MRQGASLLNVMVFMMFVVMIMAQVFFFAKSSADSVSEERELLMYRMNLDSLVEAAKDALRSNEIVHNTRLDETGGALKFSEFCEGARAKRDSGGNSNWEIPSAWKAEGYKDVYSLTIHDLDYSFDQSGFDRDSWTDGGYGTSSTYKKPFASMLPLGDKVWDVVSADDGSGDVSVMRRDGAGKPVISPVRNRFFLIRAWAGLPENYYGIRLMYQVLVSRDNEGESSHNVQTLSFQEVWF
ncbi:MAG: hypothetical protein IJP86_08430 [Synergistaceae bacterium]|nr:hypothetical protein [Synergistaceae bacterium]